MRIAHGLFVWQEPQEMLEACLRSTADVVDEVIIAEGLIEGVPDLGLPHHTDLGWLVDADYLPASVPISSKHASSEGLRPWPTLSSACTWILGKARQLDCDWLLYIDADQELHNGDQLRDWLRATTASTLPLTRQEPGGRMIVPWQCIHVPSFTRYVSGCYVLETADGRVANLVPPDSGWLKYALPSAPWISHHPERRPPWRRAQRLGSFETVLEPPPLDAVTLSELVSLT